MIALPIAVVLCVTICVMIMALMLTYSDVRRFEYNLKKQQLEFNHEIELKRLEHDHEINMKIDSEIEKKREESEDEPEYTGNYPMTETQPENR